MLEPDWKYILKVQQKDFLENLKASLEINSITDRSNLSLLENVDYPIFTDSSIDRSSVSLDDLHDNYPVFTYSSNEVINLNYHPDEESEINFFCEEMTRKQGYNPDKNSWVWSNKYISKAPDFLVSNKLSKIGEEAVKKYLDSMDFDFAIEGSGTHDFILNVTQNIKICVSTSAIFRLPWWMLPVIDDDGEEYDYRLNYRLNTYKLIEHSLWITDHRALRKCNFTIFVLVLNEVIGLELKGKPYRCLIAGFLPSADIWRTSNRSITALLYSGGMRECLKYLVKFHLK